ncbi:MAG: DUF2779 domain-containing protein, partial [Bacteroidetes bacterium]|nr:DUF2779 domain-containing protein [Bacteroidota bacterium]
MKTFPKHVLSKSTYIAGCQCTKKLWYHKNRKDLWQAPDAMTQAIFDQGHRVGELSQELFPGGVNMEPPAHARWEYQKSAALTQEKIAEGVEVIYEATFQHNEVMAALDILVKKNGKWYAYEVKSSTGVKEVNINDVALQYWVITNSGLNLEDISLVYINNQYIRKGAIDVHQLFSITSLKEDVLERQAGIDMKVEELKGVSAMQEEPKRDIGGHCYDPYECTYVDHCWSHVPVDSVFDLGRMHFHKQMELYEKGIVDLLDVPDDMELSGAQRIQVNQHKNGEVHINKQGIKDFLDTLSYPMYYLDFESFSSSIPPFDGLRPYQQIPFQYSMHYKETKDAELQHFEFLAEPTGDPREDIIKD